MRLFEVKKVVPAPTYHIHMEVTQEEYQNLLRDMRAGSFGILQFGTQRILNTIVSAVSSAR